MNALRIVVALLVPMGLAVAQPPQRGVARPPAPALASAAGTYHALIIGIDSYSALPKLHTAVSDARSIETALRDGYGFHTRLLLDGEATRDAILLALDNYRSALAANDNFLIYYAGHGQMDNAAQRAYWLPVDSNTSPVRWISADDIATAVRAIPARHILVISDSCYSGDLAGFRAVPSIVNNPADHAAYLQRMIASKSRTFIASGGDEPVADGGPAGHSIFTGAVLRGLRALEGNAFTAENLFDWYVREPVSGGSRQTPHFAPMRDTGHDLGDFVFLPADSASSAPPVTSSTNAPPARFDAAAETWALIKDSTNPEDFESFAQAYPTSDLAAGARIRAAQLRRASNPAPVAPRVETAKAASTTKVNPKDGLTYVWIPPGTFMMGCSPGDNECFDDEKPAHQVTVTTGFWLGQTDVTQAAYQRVTGKDPSRFKGANLPVESVTWDEANSYCRAIGGRLPDEAEWEYAARAGSTGSRYGNIDRIAWYSGNSGGTAHEVGQKEPNAWGLYDMLGNVWQWLLDWYHEGSYSAGQGRAGGAPAISPGRTKGASKSSLGGLDTRAASNALRELRGGAWGSEPVYVRVSRRGRYDPALHDPNFGMRCVWEQ